MTAPALRVRGRYPIKPGGKAVAPSVTTIVGMLDKPGLAWGAAKETALFAIHHQDEWMTLTDEDAYERLRKHHAGVWSDKAARGTLVHALATDWANGKTVDCPAECDPYLDSLEQFYRDHQPQWLHVERSVIYDKVPSHAYGGSFDWIATLNDGRTVLGDFKTGKRYPVEVILQMAGYRYANHMAVVDDLGQFIDTEPMPAVDACCVLYLHDDGTYELLDLPVTRDVHGQFLRLRDIWAWRQDAEKWLKANPEAKRVMEGAA